MRNDEPSDADDGNRLRIPLRLWRWRRVRTRQCAARDGYAFSNADANANANANAESNANANAKSNAIPVIGYDRGRIARGHSARTGNLCKGSVCNQGYSRTRYRNFELQRRADWERTGDRVSRDRQFFTGRQRLRRVFFLTRRQADISNKPLRSVCEPRSGRVLYLQGRWDLWLVHVRDPGAGQ